MLSVSVLVNKSHITRIQTQSGTDSRHPRLHGSDDTSKHGKILFSQPIFIYVGFISRREWPDRTLNFRIYFTLPIAGSHQYSYEKL